MTHFYNACFSGGRESAAAVLKLLEIGAPVDSLIFADTKIEKQPTYDFVKEFYGYTWQKIIHLYHAIR